MRSTVVTAIINTRQMMRITSRREKEHLDLFPHMAGRCESRKEPMGKADGMAPMSGMSHPEQHIALSKNW